MKNKIFIETIMGERLIGLEVKPKKGANFGGIPMSSLSNGLWLLREHIGKFSFVSHDSIKIKRVALSSDQERMPLNL